MRANTKSLPRWNLNDIFDENNPNFIEKAIFNLEKNVLSIESYKNKLRKNISSKNFLKLLKLIDLYHQQKNIIDAYFEIKQGENVFDLETNKNKTDTEKILNNFDDRLIFFDRWWKKLDEQNAKRLMSLAGKDFKHELRQIRQNELAVRQTDGNLISEKNIGVKSLKQIYSLLIKNLKFKLKVGDETKILTVEEIESYFYSGNKKLRKRAYDEYFEEFENGIGPTLSYIYEIIIKDIIGEKKKGVSQNYISKAILDQMFTLIRKNISIFQQYFELKSKLLKLKKATAYDLNIPFKVPASMRKIDFFQAKKIILKSFFDFSPVYGNSAKKIFDSNHIDAQNRQGKFPMNFTVSVSNRIPSYINVVFNKDLESLIILSHEVGHAVHDDLSGHHKFVVREPSIFLMELSSSLSELIVFDKLFSETNEVKDKIYILGSMLDNILTLIFKMGYLAIWEEKTFGNITKDSNNLKIINEEYLALIKEQFGEKISVPQKFRWEWMTIPHFFENPFWIYSYAVNEIIALHLFNRFKKNGPKYAKNILKILSAGGSAYPMEILARARINIKSNKFWQDGFNIIKKMIDDFELLIS